MVFRRMVLVAHNLTSKEYVDTQNNDYYGLVLRLSLCQYSAGQSCRSICYVTRNHSKKCRRLFVLCLALSSNHSLYGRLGSLLVDNLFPAGPQNQKIVPSSPHLLSQVLKCMPAEPQHLLQGNTQTIILSPDARKFLSCLWMKCFQFPMLGSNAFEAVSSQVAAV